MNPSGAAKNDGSANRDAILVAATSVIARSGVRGLRIEEVASEAGVSPGLLYYHFESRAGLIAATFDRAASRAPSARITDADGSRPGLEVVREALLAELDEGADVRDNAVVWGEISATAVFDPAVRDGLVDAWTSWRDAVAAGLEAGIDDGSVRPEVDPARAADRLISLVDGLCTRWLSRTLERARALDLLDEELATLAPDG